MADGKIARVLVCAGTRPEALKLAPVVKLLQGDSRLTHFFCVTGQHNQLLQQVLDVMRISPDADLSIMEPDQSLEQLSSSLLLSLDPVFDKFKPNITLVQGDTASAFFAALGSFYKKIPVAHIEAGLRTNDLYNPWPEEAYRSMISKLAKIHFAPTELAKLNLIKEGITQDRIFVTGNTIIDALFEVSESIERDKDLLGKLESSFSDIDNRKLVLVTAHRREHYGAGFLDIFKGIKRLSENHEELLFVIPLHLNPNVREPACKILEGTRGVKIIEPLDYLSFVYLMKKAYLILTDSGGVQEEAAALGKPVLVLRDRTERQEALECGTAKLVGTDANRLMSTVSELINDVEVYEAMSNADNPFGDGKAAERIVNLLSSLDSPI